MITLTHTSKTILDMWTAQDSNYFDLKCLVAKLPNWETLIHSVKTFGLGTLYAEYHDKGKNSHKYYAIEIVGNDVNVRWGPIHRAGTSQKVSLETAKKRWESKLKKGYKPLPSKYTGTPLEKTEKLDYCPLSSLFQVYVRGINRPICQIPTKSAIDLYLSHYN